LTMLSLKSLLLPTMVRTLSGWSMVVANMPISLTVPVMPAAEMKSPTLNGRRMMRKAPAAKFASRPLQAAPMAMPAAAEQLPAQRDEIAVEDAVEVDAHADPRERTPDIFLVRDRAAQGRGRPPGGATQYLVVAGAWAIGWACRHPAPTCPPFRGLRAGTAGVGFVPEGPTLRRLR